MFGAYIVFSGGIVDHPDFFYYFLHNKYIYDVKLCFVNKATLILTSEHPLMFYMIELSEPVPGLYHTLTPIEKNHQ